MGGVGFGGQQPFGGGAGGQQLFGADLGGFGGMVSAAPALETMEAWETISCGIPRERTVLIKHEDVRTDVILEDFNDAWGSEHTGLVHEHMRVSRQIC
jgi:hypothetical protein